jgi:hypothetical protein
MEMEEGKIATAGSLLMFNVYKNACVLAHFCCSVGQVRIIFEPTSRFTSAIERSENGRRR